jgi:hypothetical protein
MTWDGWTHKFPHRWWNRDHRARVYTAREVFDQDRAA